VRNGAGRGPRRREILPSLPTVLHTRVVTGTGGGPDKTILNSPRFLDGFGYRTLCAYMHPPGDPGLRELRAKADRWAAPFFAVEDRGPWDWKVVSQFLQICRKEAVTIWHGHDYKSNALGLLLRRFWPMHLVTTVHGWVRHTRRTPFYYFVDRFCLPRYDQVICVSSDLYESALACGVAEDRCVLVENAIDTAEFSRSATPDEAKKRCGLSPERFVLGAVGRLSAEKGFDILIQAADRLLKSGFDLELIIVGEGDQREQLNEMVSRLGRADRIHLLGYRTDVKALYESMDVFALSSLREGLPNVLLEALALEVPVVATRIAGIPRLITNGVNGLLVEPGSVEELTQTLARLLGDAELRRRLANLGREMVERFSSFEVRMQKIRRVYEGFVGPGTPPPAATDNTTADAGTYGHDLNVEAFSSQAVASS